MNKLPVTRTAVHMLDHARVFRGSVSVIISTWIKKKESAHKDLAITPAISGPTCYKETSDSCHHPPNHTRAQTHTLITRWPSKYKNMCVSINCNIVSAFTHHSVEKPTNRNAFSHICMHAARTVTVNTYEPPDRAWYCIHTSAQTHTLAGSHSQVLQFSVRSSCRGSEWQVTFMQLFWSILKKLLGGRTCWMTLAGLEKAVSHAWRLLSPSLKVILVH